MQRWFLSFLTGWGLLFCIGLQMASWKRTASVCKIIWGWKSYAPFLPVSNQGVWTTAFKNSAKTRSWICQEEAKPLQPTLCKGGWGGERDRWVAVGKHPSWITILSFNLFCNVFWAIKVFGSSAVSVQLDMSLNGGGGNGRASSQLYQQHLFFKKK